MTDGRSRIQDRRSSTLVGVLRKCNGRVADSCAEQSAGSERPETSTFQDVLVGTLHLA
jgi:hypothetical protein